MDDSIVNINYEIKKIIKYSLKKSEMTGGSKENKNNLNTYTNKINEHIENILRAGFTNEDIKNMLKGGKYDINRLVQQINETVPNYTSAVNQAIDQTTKEWEQKLLESHQQLKNAKDTVSKNAREFEDQLKTKDDALKKQKELAEKLAQERDIIRAELANTRNKCESDVKTIIDTIMNKFDKGTIADVAKNFEQAVQESAMRANAESNKQTKGQ